MTKKRKAFIILACIVIALVAGILGIFATNKASGELVEVWSAKEKIYRGEVFIKEKLELIKIADDEKTSLMFTVDREKDLLNLAASKDIEAGAPILSSYTGSTQVIKSISEGMVKHRAEIKAKDQTGVLPGDRVNILATRVLNSGVAMTVRVATNVKVLSLVYSDAEVTKQIDVDEAAKKKESGAVEEISSENSDFPKYVDLEVTPELSLLLQNSYEEKERITLEYDPWGYEIVDSLKRAIDRTIEDINSTNKDFAKAKKDYDKLLKLRTEMSGKISGYSSEKEFLLKTVRAQIEILKTFKISADTDKKFAVSELNKLREELSVMQTGWWEIEDEVKGIDDRIKSLGGAIKKETTETKKEEPAQTETPINSPADPDESAPDV